MSTNVNKISDVQALQALSQLRSQCLVLLASLPSGPVRDQVLDSVNSLTAAESLLYSSLL